MHNYGSNNKIAAMYRQSFTALNSIPFINSLQLIAFQSHIATDGIAQQTCFRDLGVNCEKSQVLPSELQKTLGCYSYASYAKKRLPKNHPGLRRFIYMTRLSG